MNETQSNIPQLVALVYRSGKGCRQYSFASIEQLDAWTSRHPYRNEQLRVIPVKDRKQVGDKWLPATEAANYLRSVL